MSDTTELIDKNIDKLVEAIKAAGPSAEYGLQETLGYISVSAYGEIILMIITFLIGSIALIFGIRYAIKVDWADKSIAPVVIPGIILFISTMVIMKHFSQALGKAIHPTGYLVMKVLE